MKIGRLVANEEGVIEEIPETTSYGNWDEALAAAEILKTENENNENVYGIFVGAEISPTDYIIKTVI